MPLKVAVLDAHPVYRVGLREVLSKENVRVVAEAGDVTEAWAAVETSRPDLVLLDLTLPGLDGITATRELLRRDPGHRVLILHVRLEESTAADALAAGALGFFSKDQSIPDLIDAVRTVGEGRKYLPPRVSAKDIEARVKRGRPGPLGILSAREREVFDLLVRGLTNEAVSKQLGISRRTVETHRGRILKKLNVHSAVELIRLAAKCGALGA